jgi:chaperone modulatory protein CbpM
MQGNAQAKGVSLECGGPAPLWPAAAWRRFVENYLSYTVCGCSRWTKAAPGRRTPRRRPWRAIMLRDSDMDEALTFDVVAETVGARRSLVVHLARQGLIETIIGDAGEPLLPRSAIMQLRRMQRLHRDLGVNFTGAAIILDLVGRIEQLNRELRGQRPGFD